MLSDVSRRDASDPRFSQCTFPDENLACPKSLFRNYEKQTLVLMYFQKWL